MDKDENGKLCAKKIDVEVIVETVNGTTIQRELKFEPIFEVIENSYNGEEIVNELWASIE